MSYVKAEEVLPKDIIELIQHYVDGKNIYIPRKECNKREWGEKTSIRQELKERNLLIFNDYQEGCTTSELAKKYFLSEKSIQRIIYTLKNAI